MRTTYAAMAAAAVLVTGLAPAASGSAVAYDPTGAAGEARGVAAPPRVVKSAGRPPGANPYLALLPDPDKADYRRWQRYLESRSGAWATARKRSLLGAGGPIAQDIANPLLVDEEEPRGTRGSNDTTATAQSVPEFGSGDGEEMAARVLGSLSPEPAPLTRILPSRENDGAIPLSRGTGIGTSRLGILTTGRIGDGPHGRAGSGRGDFDFYTLRGRAGREIVARVTTPQGRLDPMVAVYDNGGELLALNDDYTSLDSFLRFAVPANGLYHVMVTGFPVLPNNPFRAGSGTGAGSQGPYELRLQQQVTDVDMFAVELEPGDVIGTSVSGAAGRVTILDPAGVPVHGSEQDLTFIYPMGSPLPGGGNAVAEHVADEGGTHYVAFALGAGDYQGTVEVYRPRQGDVAPSQTLYLDFDGQRVNTGVFFGPGVRTLSPLRAFLGRWGLTAADEDALITGIVAEVEENLRADLEASGLNDDFDIEILNSRDDADPFGQPNVSRVIVGGTIEESGVPTIGIAQSIDPGNFEGQETALVLLDVLSDTTGDFGDASLNFYLRPGSDRLGFVAQAVGNVVSHEAGHFFGDWHVDQFNDQPNLMDQGGNFPVLYGVGPDQVGGTGDDVDVDFGEDDFNPFEGFTGVEDTLSRLAMVLNG